MAKTATQTKPATFSSVLDMPASDIERPKPAPVGSYICVVQGQPRIDKSAKKQTEFSEYNLKVLEPLDDVDVDALETYLTNKDGTKRRITDQSFKVTFYHTESSIYRLKEFLEHCGIDMDEAESEGTSLRQLIAESPGKQVVAHVFHEASQDGETVYAKVKNTTAVD